MNADSSRQPRRPQIVLGITGGIAAYKSAELTRLLVRQGLDVRVVMTEHATRFITPLTFQALSGNRVISSLFDPPETAGLHHTALADSADLMVIAPATANIIGKMAAGIADDFLSTLLLAFDKPVLLAPAMNPRMFSHPATVRNLAVLRERGTTVIGPDSGDTACGHQGRGRMSAPEEIAERVRAMLQESGMLAGKRVLIASGPTREMIDPVRFISNRSTGKMGAALAAAARAAGADVTVVTGPVNVQYDPGIAVVGVISADEMADAMFTAALEADIIIMAAAVADWKPRVRHPGKWKKSGADSAAIELVATRDILAELGKRKTSGQILVGFAAETGDPSGEAVRKMREKHLDYIIGNDVSQAGSGFESDTNTGVLLASDGRKILLEMQSKYAFARRILEVIQGGS